MNVNNLHNNVPWTVAMGFLTFNHSCNFFLYLISGQQFRQWFAEAVCGRCRSLAPAGGGGSTGTSSAGSAGSRAAPPRRTASDCMHVTELVSWGPVLSKSQTA